MWRVTARGATRDSDQVELFTHCDGIAHIIQRLASTARRADDDEGGDDEGGAPLGGGESSTPCDQNTPEYWRFGHGSKTRRELVNPVGN